MFSAVGAGDSLFFDIVCHLLVAPAGDVCAVEVLDKIICTVAGLALLTVHKRVAESAEMTRSHPCLGVHKDSCIKTDVILVFLNEFFEPCSLDVVFQSHAERAVVPCVCKTSVNFRTRIYKASAFAQGNDLFHSFFRIFHFITSDNNGITNIIPQFPPLFNTNLTKNTVKYGFRHKTKSRRYFLLPVYQLFSVYVRSVRKLPSLS